MLEPEITLSSTLAFIKQLTDALACSFHNTWCRVRASYAEVALVCMVSSCPAWSQCPLCILQQQLWPLRVWAAHCYLTQTCPLSIIHRIPIFLMYLKKMYITLSKNKHFFFFHLKNQTMFLQSISGCCSFHWLTCVHLHILSSPKPWIFTRYFGYIGKRVKGRRTYAADLQ